MAEDEEKQDAEVETTPKKSKLPLMLGLLLGLAGGAGGFYATFSGLLDPTGAEAAQSPGPEGAEMGPKVDYVELDQIRVSLRAPAEADHLIFRASLEVAPTQVAAVTKVTPRILDVLNTYLRAIDPGEFGDPTLLTRLRSQMLRRVQMVAGEDRVKDILIMEFVLN